MDNQRGASAGLAYYIFLRKRARKSPNFIVIGADALYIEAFTDRVTSLGY